MTGEEAKRCLLSRQEVVYRGIRYERVKQIIYWPDEKNNIMVSLTLCDKCGNSTTTALMKDVEIAPKGEETK